jgi:hypothetical protein
MNEANQQAISIATPTAEVGKSIVAAAEEQRRQRFQEKVVAIADSEMEAKIIAERKIEFYQKCLKMSNKRLAAIEAGEWKIVNGQFAFNDAELAKGVMVPLKDEDILLGFYGGAAGRGKQLETAFRTLTHVNEVG